MPISTFKPLSDLRKSVFHIFKKFSFFLVTAFYFTRVSGLKWFRKKKNGWERPTGILAEVHGLRVLDSQQHCLPAERETEAVGEIHGVLLPPSTVHRLHA